MLFIDIADVPYIPISKDRGFTALLVNTIIAYFIVDPKVSYCM